MHKAKQTVHHTLGRCTYHNKKHKLDEPGELMVPPSTTEKWLYGHVRRDETVIPSAVETYNKVSEAWERNKAKGKRPNSSNVISDELEEVFVKKQNGGIRGYSSHMSKKQVEMAAIGAAALHQRDDENALKLNKIEVKMGNLGGKMVGLYGDLGFLGSAVEEILTCMKRKAPTSSARLGTPSPEKGSNSLFGHPNDESMDHADSLSDESPSLQVEQLDNRERVVASGCIAGGDYCHSRKVKPTEKRVLVEEVHDQSALVWDAPQGNGWVYLRDLELPTWVVWSENRLQLVQIKE